jgi:iron complex outermembrane recepter protein
LIRYLSSLPLLVLAAPALAQAPTAIEEEEQAAQRRSAAPNEILVVAERFGGQLDVPQEPIATFDEAEIQALGASSVTDLLAAIAPQTGSGRGRGDGPPIVLVNGQRIASFREMRNYPPEAIKRVEVLPEEVALRLGYPADARVVNLILKDNYKNRRVELEYALPTRGGFAEWEAESTLLRIAGPKRFSVTLTAQDRSPLFESERGVLQTSAPPPGSPDPARFRTLIADSRGFGLNLNWSTGLGKDGKGGQLSLNGNATRDDSRSGSGLDALTAPLERFNRATNLSAGMGLNSALGPWQLALTADAAHGEVTTRIDRFAGTGFDLTTSNTERLTSLATLSGRPLRLPAGEVAVTLKAGYNWSNITSRDTRSGAGVTDLTRGRVATGFNLSLPLTSRREQVGAGLGDVTLNFSADYDHLSDFGALSGWSAGVTWSPLKRLDLQASYLVVQAAPTLTQLGSPQTVTFNVPVYDFTRGETALITLTSGGNPGLRKEEQRDWKFGATWQVPFLPNATLLTEYFRNRSDNVTAVFPLLTPEIEAAFPGRVTRDGTGRLVGIDTRAVTFAAQSAERLRWGLNLSGTIGKPAAGGGPGAMFGGGGARPPGAGGGGPRPPGAGGGGGPRGPGGMMAMMGGGQGRWSLGLFHTAQFSSTVLIAPGGPELDLLGGDALSTSGTPRHSIELNGGLFHKGKGLFFNGTWTAPTRIEASGLPGSSDLRFGSLTRLNLNLFMELGEQGKLAQHSPFLKGLRLSLRFENLFDSRQQVTDGAGLVPLSYQKDYLDPRGRVIELELRKMF